MNMEEPVRAEVVNEYTVTSMKYTDDETSDAFSEFQGDVLWPRRSLLYRVSFLAILPLFAIFLMGFTSPFWMKKNQVDKYRGHYNMKVKVDVSIGLWRVCEGTDYSDITDCTVIPDVTPYFVVCQSMLCLSLIFTVFSLIFGLYENCATRYDMEEGNEVRTKRPEMNAVMAGLFGLTGVCMYGTSIIEAARNDEGAVQWAFPVTAASVTGVIVCGILMAISNTIHSATPSFPGQIMSLSRQNSLRVRESALQERLVITSDSANQSPGAQASGSMYGVKGPKLEDKTVSFLKRSESCLSSHMSSPDIFTATSQDPSFSNSYRSTYVVEPHDIHARAYDHARRQALKQQLQDKAAQRRSWHFDDRTGAYIVTDLINNNPNDSSLCESLGDDDEVKPPVPPRRDNPSSSKPLSATDSVSSIHKEAPDLMLVGDPVVTAPGHLEQSSKSATRTETTKRNTNPFIEDNATDTSQNDLQHSTLSNSSWDSQHWPDPPAECDMLRQKASPVPTNSSTASDRSASSPLAFQLNAVPESLQYQPQNFTNHPRKPEPTEASKIVYNPLKHKEGHTKLRRNHSDLPLRYSRSGIGKNTSPLDAQVPIMQEYDNPLFKSQSGDIDRHLTLGENFSLQICESTSFVHPSPEQPPPSSFYAAVITSKGDSPSNRRPNSHHATSPLAGNSENTKQSSSHSNQDKNRDVPPPAYSRFISKKVEDSHKKQSSLKEKTKSSSKHHQNGIVKSRPRQVKREHQQRRNETGSPQNVAISQHPVLYGSSPNLTSRSPRVGRRRPDSVGPGNEVVYLQGDCIRSMSVRTKTPERSSGPYGYTISRQPQTQFYTTQPGQYRHWGDSDL